MNKPLFYRLMFFAGLFLISLLVGTLLASGSAKKTPPIVAPTPIPTQKTSFPSALLPVSVYSGPVEYVRPQNLSAAPEEIFLYTINTSEANGEKAVSSVAQKLGFLSQPDTSLTTKGSRYFWSNGKSNLTISGSPQYIYYYSGLDENVSPTSADTSGAAKVVKDMIERLGVLPQNYSLPAPTIEYLKTEGPNATPGTSSSASVFTLAYRPALDGISIYDNTASNYPLFFRFLANGSLVSFSVMNLTGTNQAGSVQRIISPEGAIIRLRNNSGSIVGASPVNSQTTMFAPDFLFSSIKIVGLSLGYFAKPNTQTLIPVYVARGEAKNTKNGEMVLVDSFVLATP